MNKLYLLIASACFVMLFGGCHPKYFQVDAQLLQQKIYEQASTKYEGLQQTTVLYLDHSTCVIDAVKNSEVFKALRANLGQYSDTLLLIKGNKFDTITLNRQNNKVSEVLETIKKDISRADIRTAVFQICNNKQQAILISDCESFANGRFLDLEAYMTEPFKVWLEKGHSIYIITEPYQEKYHGRVYSKKRFYIIFTDDRMQAPISHNLLGQIQHLLQNGECTLFKMTNTDITVESPKSDMIDSNLSFEVEYFSGFELVSIDDSWDDIREYVMRLNKYGQPLPEDEPQPLVKNLIFNDGENYVIEDVQIMATNITEKYLALEDSTILVSEINISDGFMLDEEALQNNKLNVMLTDKIFTADYLSDEYGGNLIRLDFVITNVSLKPYEPAMFEWKSLYSNDTAICVSKSIDNALRDVNVIPTSPNRRVIHTIFIKTGAY